MGYSPMTEGDRELCFFEDNAAMKAFLAAFAREFGRRFEIGLPMPLIRDTRRRFCIAHYTAPYVAPDGSLAPCCEISPPSPKVGNVFEEDFWNNAFFQRFRQEFVNGFPVHPRCEYCPTSSMGRAKGFTF
jgi:radical SAM protein with 4Fe4S-binding SPASM domain